MTTMLQQMLREGQNCALAISKTLMRIRLRSIIGRRDGPWQTSAFFVCITSLRSLGWNPSHAI